MADRTDMERDKPFRSLRLEFAALFFALMAGAVAVMFLTNNVFLERYYNQEKQDTLEETYERLNTAASSNSIESIAFGYGNDIRGHFFDFIFPVFSKIGFIILHGPHQFA